MGFRNTRQRTDETAAATDRRASSGRSASSQERHRGQLAAPRSIEDGESHYGMSIPDRRTLQRLRHHESTFGKRRVDEWVDEGMPAEIMGKTRDMEAFRQRQADRPSAVPTDIERRNRRSVLRSEQAAGGSERTGETDVPKSVRGVISSTGRSLDASIQRAMEDRMGDSLGDVRIHTGPQAAAACEAINARAFTVGNHVAFNQGEYDPESPEGQHVLAHELAHVRQQTGGAVSMLPQEDVELEVDPDPALEHEAEETAQRVMQGGELGVQRLADTEIHVQRKGLGSRVQDGTNLSKDPPPSPKEKIDTQQLLEQTVAEASEIDWVSVFKTAGIEMVKSAPGVGAVVSTGLAVTDDITSQMRADESITEDGLIEQLEQKEPPNSWVSDIAEQAADIVRNNRTGSETVVGEGGNIQ